MLSGSTRLVVIVDRHRAVNQVKTQAADPGLTFERRRERVDFLGTVKAPNLKRATGFAHPQFLTTESVDTLPEPGIWPATSSLDKRQVPNSSPNYKRAATLREPDRLTISAWRLLWRRSDSFLING